MSEGSRGGSARGHAVMLLPRSSCSHTSSLSFMISQNFPSSNDDMS